MKIIKSVVIFLAALVNVYLLFAFGNWDLNPANWGSEVRVYMLFLSVVVGILSVGFYLEHTQSSDK